MNEERTTKNEERPAPNRLLLHTCCGPCSTYVATAFREEGFALTGYFFNPNIHPYDEHQKRREAAELWSKEAGVPLVVEDGYALDFWLAAVSADLSKRCQKCYGLRLLATAQKAKDLGFARFSTTLLISPYQKHDQVREEGEAASAKVGVSFLYRDFRPWFKETYGLSRQIGLYRQNYCGCLVSDYERAQRRPPQKGHNATNK